MDELTRRILETDKRIAEAEKQGYPALKCKCWDCGKEYTTKKVRLSVDEWEKVQKDSRILSIVCDDCDATYTEDED